MPMIALGLFCPLGPSRAKGKGPMIQLTRLNNHPLAVNSDLIKFIEQAPDTVITLVTGEKVLVRESAEDILNRIVEFRRSVLSGIVPGWDGSVVPPLNPKASQPETQE